MQYNSQGQPLVGHQMFYQPAPAPAKVEEPKPGPDPSVLSNPNTEYWCRELDGTWSQRTATDVERNCKPGFWQKHAISGYPVFYRQKP